MNNEFIVKRAMKAEQGYWITHYEFLSIIGKIEEFCWEYHVEVYNYRGEMVNSYDTFNSPDTAYELEKRTKFRVTVRSTKRFFIGEPERSSLYFAFNLRTASPLCDSLALIFTPSSTIIVSNTFFNSAEYPLNRFE